MMLSCEAQLTSARLWYDVGILLITVSTLCTPRVQFIDGAAATLLASGASTPRTSHSLVLSGGFMSLSATFIARTLEAKNYTYHHGQDQQCCHHTDQHVHHGREAKSWAWSL
jgi:hypothetical protein